MLPHQIRVVEEKEELDSKLGKLQDFMQGDVFAAMPAVEQGLLMVQVRAMRLYSETLLQRIETFNQ